MNSEAQSPQLEGITYGDRLPLTWELLPGPPSEGERHRLNRANEELLQNLLLLDEATQDIEEKEEGGGQEHIKRLEAKLDLLLSLVSEMMTTNGAQPEQYALTLGTRGLCVHTEKGIAQKEGALLRIRLYLNPQFPRPLDICGYLTAVQADGFTVTYCPFEESLQSLMDKYVFRQHRRAVALARRRENP